MSQPLHRETPGSQPSAVDSRAQHPSLASLSDFDAALALAGIRTDAPSDSRPHAGTADGRDGRPDQPRMASVSIPGHRFGSPRGRAWRTRRRQAWLMGDHGTATLLTAHRSTSGPAPGGAPAA